CHEHRLFRNYCFGRNVQEIGFKKHRSNHRQSKMESDPQAKNCWIR
nr:hypothetical protein [Tanacetum cinerariifolium]